MWDLVRLSGNDTNKGSDDTLYEFRSHYSGFKVTKKKTLLFGVVSIV